MARPGLLDDWIGTLSNTETLVTFCVYASTRVADGFGAAQPDLMHAYRAG